MNNRRRGISIALTTVIVVIIIIVVAGGFFALFTGPDASSPGNGGLWSMSCQQLADYTNQNWRTAPASSTNALLAMQIKNCPAPLR